MKEDTAQHSICSSTFQTLARAWRYSSSPTSYKLLNYAFISYGHTSQVSPKENPPQDTSAVCGCQDPLLWQQPGTSPKEKREFPGAKTKPWFVPASTEQCAGGASSHPLESRAVLPILPSGIASLSPWLWVKHQSSQGPRAGGPPGPPRGTGASPAGTKQRQEEMEWSETRSFGNRV